MLEFEQTMRTIALGGIALFTALLLVRLWWAWRSRTRRQPLASASLSAKLLQPISVLALALAAYGLLAHLFVIQRGTALMPFPLQAILGAVISLYLLLEIVLALWPRPRPAWARIAGALAMAGLAAFGLLLSVNAQRALAYPGADQTVTLERPPFEGEWAVIGAGATAATNHHDRISSQKYAADMAAVCEDGRLFRGEGLTHEESCTFGARVLAPSDGVVVHALDGLRDGASRDVLPGNHVVIDVGGGRYVALAHLQQGSVRVSEGDSVRAGQEIGLAGNSGNSDFPHLHMHVQDTPIYDHRVSRALPYRFAELERRRFLWWGRVQNAALISNDRVRPAER